ncbi:MAG: hypothetical protein ACREHF_13135, partial [Rhizomicrobium sp.]
KRLEKLPFRIAHQSANHFCLPQEAVLNHIAAWLRIPLSTGPRSKGALWQRTRRDKRGDTDEGGRRDQKQFHGIGSPLRLERNA